MKYRMNQTFLNVKNEPFKGTEGDEPVTFGGLAVQALLADVNGSGAPVSGQQKLKRFEVYLKVRKAQDAKVEEIQLGADDVQLLSEAMEIFTTLLYGLLKQFLDQKE